MSLRSSLPAGLAALALLCCGPVWAYPALNGPGDGGHPVLVAQATTDEVPPTPPAAPTPPKHASLALWRVVNTSLVSTSGDQVHVMLTSEGIRSLDRAQYLALGTDIGELHVSADGVKVRWLPVSLYVRPVVRHGYFTRTLARGDGKADANVQTVYRYNTFELYGVVTANMSHLLDLQGTPFVAEHPRAGIGMRWAHKRNVTTADPGESPMVRTHGWELSHSLSGEDTWYLGYVIGVQK